MDTEAIITSFMSLGLSKQKATETIKNDAVSKNLIFILNEIRGVVLTDGMGTLLYHLATKIKPQINHHLAFLTKYIITKKLDNTLRVDKALEYVMSNINHIDTAEFEKYCGVGVIVTKEQIKTCVDKHINEIRDELIQKRYRFNIGPLMQNIREELKWADGKTVKNEIDASILSILGPKTKEDIAPPTAPSSEKKVSKVSKDAQEGKTTKNNEKGSNTLTIMDIMKKINFHAPGENYKTDGYLVTDRTEELLKEHLKITGGKIRTRFPPEPNGILHIGHAKAININFGYAKANDGVCFLRYDDTNPEKEEEKFFSAIHDVVTWLGYKPYKITHSSDYFDQLYEWAIKLINKNLAYVCHQTAEEMRGFNPVPSPWRNRSIEENLQLFQDMKRGKIDEGKATLRLKCILEEGKMDPVAYRIRFVPHHRTNDKWCIYPTYDYAHCLCDSIENITHSLCTKEFQSRRSSYYWLCNALDIYCPVQWEYGRLNINYTVVSKRKIAKLITERIVNDWDDPRLFTLTALRRRGIPPEAINNFCAQLGVTGAQSTVDPIMLDAYVRDYLNEIAPRRMVVLEPLKIIIENYPEGTHTNINIPDFPTRPNDDYHTVKFDKVLYIERSDFMEIGDKSYRRLTKTQSVGLRHANYVINVIDIHKNNTGDIIEIICNCTNVTEIEQKPKAFIHWVADPMEIEVRLYSHLFKHKNPEDTNEVPDGFLSDCNLDSLKILKCYADKSLKNVKVFDKFQFERTGFFSVDSDTSKEKIVFNKTVNLKEDVGK